MEAKELRIGNYIRVKGETNNALLVRCLDGKLIRTNYLSLQSCEFEPIPLTEEWLVRFGFIKKCDYEQQDWEWGKLSILNSRRGVGLYNYTGDRYLDYWCITFREDVGCGWCDLNEIEYVHQLQNLYFALTGEELELK